MICLGKEGDSGTDLLKLLNVLLSTETGSQDKCQTLESEVSLMCNLSKGVEEKGKIYGAITAYKDVMLSEDVIIKKLKEKFRVTEEVAKIYLKEVEKA